MDEIVFIVNYCYIYMTLSILVHFCVSKIVEKKSSGYFIVNGFGYKVKYGFSKLVFIHLSFIIKGILSS